LINKLICNSYHQILWPAITANLIVEYRAQFNSSDDPWC